MFERFTDRARRVVVLAQEEARLLHHSYIGTEHILLGLVHEGDGVAVRALQASGVSLARAREQVEEIIGHGPMVPSGHIPFTPRAKKVLELSLREALQLGHNYIGTEHILLGLLREGEGVGAQVLASLGVDLGRVRSVVIEILAGAPVGDDPGRGVADFVGRSQVAAFATPPQRGLAPARCSFCGVPSPMCGALFAGQAAALICEHCLRRGAAGLATEPASAMRPHPPAFGAELVSIDELAARHAPTGPPPEDEDAARAGVEHAFRNTSEHTSDGRGLVNIEHGEELAVYADTVQAKFGAAAAQVEMRVERVKFLSPTEAVVWLTTFRHGVPFGPIHRREGRAVLSEGRWKVSYDTMRELWVFAGVHAPPRAGPPVDPPDAPQ